MVPVITTAAYLKAGLSTALIYPIVVPSVAFLVGLWLMPETRKMKIWDTQTVGAPGR